MTKAEPRVTDRQLSRWKNEALEGAFEQQNSKEWSLYVRIASLISDIQNYYKPLLKSSSEHSNFLSRVIQNSRTPDSVAGTVSGQTSNGHDSGNDSA